MIATASIIAVYLRISTNSQHNDGQRLDVTRWLESHGIDVGSVMWIEDIDSREAGHDERDAHRYGIGRELFAAFRERASSAEDGASFFGDPS